MQYQPQLDLQETAHFNVQKIITFGSAQKEFKLKSNIDKTYKNSQLFDIFFSSNHKEFIQDKFQASHNQIHQQETKKRIDLLENAEKFDENHKNMTKNIKSFGNFPFKESALTFEEQVNNIVPAVLRESIQATSRIDEKQSKLQQKLTNNQNIENDNESNNSSNVEIDLNLVSCLYQAQEAVKQQRNTLKKLSLNKQIAITYKPFKYTKYGANRSGLYQKFGKKYHEKQDIFSSQSFYSNKLQQDNQLKDCMVNSTANFSKLHEVDLFMKRKEIRLQRSDQLLQANQKLLAGHLTVKQQLQKVKKTLEKVTSQYKSKIQYLQNELKLERQTKTHIIAEKEIKQLGLKNTKALNQQYVKQNNELKEKIKEYIKIIHELKYYSVNKSTTNQHLHLQLQSKPHNCSIKTIGPQLPTINSLPSHYQVTDRSHQPIQSKKHARFHQQTDYTLVIDHFQKKETSKKGNNYQKYQNERKYSINDYNTQNNMINICKNTKSQKSIIIKRNMISQNSESIHKNFVKLNKNTVNDSSLVMKRGEDQQNKSISSNSNISGMSLAHKIGHISKYYQTKKGVLLDYMAQEGNEVEKQNKRKPQKEKNKIQNL